MFKIPSYLECFAKFVSFLGLDYCEEKRTTSKFRTAELRNFNEQADRYTNEYMPKILNLFAGKNEEKQALIEHCFIISESIARFLTSQNYYTIASNKRATWALLVFFYIPHLAYLISFYKKDFGIPECLIENDFMLPYSDADKIILPTEKLREFLKPLKKAIPTEKDTENNFLAKYLNKFDKTVIPSYHTQQRIVNQLKNIVESDAKIDEIRLLFQATIVSGRIYKELLDLFEDDAYALALVEYFKKCLKTSDRLILEDTSPHNAFENFFALYVDYYQFETFYTVAELNRSITCDFEALKAERDDYRERLFVALNAFLYTTTSATKNQLDEINTIDFTKGILRFSRLEEAESYDDDHEEIVNFLTQLDYIYSCPEKALDENEINLIFGQIQKNNYYLNYEHQFLLFSGLNDLAKNDFSNAKEKLKRVRQRCNEITAGETLVRTASLLIVLRLLTDNTISYSHLNSEIKTLIDSQPEETMWVFNPIMDSKERSKKIYLDKTIELIKEFNVNGYCRYSGVECVKYNPFKKLEAFIEGFYLLYDESIFSSAIDEIKVKKAIELLTRHRNPKYPINKALVTLYPYTALEAFNGLNFAEIAIYLYESKIESKNIEKLLNNQPMLESISKAFEKLIPSIDKSSALNEQVHWILK